MRDAATITEEAPIEAHATALESGCAPAEPTASSVDATSASSSFLARIPRDFARQHLMFSQGCTDEVERLAVAATTSPAAIFNVGVRLGRQVAAQEADPESIAGAIDAAYTRSDDHEPGTHPEVSPENVDSLLARVDRDLLVTEGKAPVIKLVDALLFEALSRHASDVHVQPLADRTLVRYRLDGVLHTVREFSSKPALPMISRIKVMGRMDIAERRVPQDGRATVTIGTRSIDLRISTLPTSYGERAVIRLLDNAAALSDLRQLGMPPHTSELLLGHALQTHGFVLVTGPTGSGKTTTLYATLGQVVCGGNVERGIVGGGVVGGVNVMTIEDPIEYELATAGLVISQSQVNLRKGVTFATGLRHILRQDPDIVMVGEIRDEETARIAIQASLTGHMVFSTLHTNDAPSAVTRLIDLGIEPYLVSAALSAVLAQRLVRLKHQACDGRGCEECLNTGYQGRTGVFELMAISESIRVLINRNAPVTDLRTAAMEHGMRLLREEGLRLVREGLTTRSEIDRVIVSVHPEARAEGAAE